MPPKRKRELETLPREEQPITIDTNVRQDGEEGAVTAIASLVKVLEGQINSQGSIIQSVIGTKQCTIFQFMELDPPAFDGNLDPYAADSWLIQMDKIFEVLGCSDEQMVSFAIFMLKGDAYNWWEFAGPKDEQISWERFKEVFYDHYVPKTFRQQKEIEFMNLVQGSMTVAQYEAKFMQLSRFAYYLVDEEERRARKFERGLRMRIRHRISVLMLKTYEDVVERAMIVERDLEELRRAMIVERDLEELRRSGGPVE